MTSIKEMDTKSLTCILRKTLDDKTLEVIDFTAENFIPIGENFGSIMVKLDIIIRKSNDKTTEKLHLVAKTVNTNERPILNWEDTFKKEVFIYTKLFPMFKELEREAGFQEKELINSIPRYYGHRFSLNDSSNIIDNNSLFMMENLKISDYYMGDKKFGLDLEHSKIAIKALARYHAMGIVLRQRKPEFFKNEVIALAQTSLGVDIEQLDKGFLGILKNFRETPCFSKHMATIESSFASCLNGKKFIAPTTEPWVSITHGDMWLNNILFHKDRNGKVDDVKFVDYQIFLVNSPLKDVPHFLCGNLEDKALINHLDELLDIYYDKFTSCLKRFKCNTDPFSRDAFDKELKRQAFYEFSICCMVRKYFAFEMKNEKNSSEVLNNFFDSSCTDAIREKLQVLVDVYEKKGWL